MKEFKIVVVGAGYMGRRHAQKVKMLSEAGTPVRLAGVIDIVEHRAMDLGRKLDVPYAVDDIASQELIARADAAIVAVPTVDHYEVVERVLLADCDVLVEKPIAATLAEGEKLLMLFQQTVLMETQHVLEP